MAIELRDRFEKKILITPGCWLWLGGVDNHGYGKLSHNGVLDRAHRISYRLYVGEIPRGTGYHGSCVIHMCDNPRCVNPDHLRLGTQAENMADKALKNRAIGAQPGEGHYRAKLTAEKVLLIRSDNRPDAVIANEFGVSRRTIYDVRTRDTWASV